MPLDPQAREWLDAMTAAGARPHHEVGVDEARTLTDANAAVVFGAVEDVPAEDVDAGGVRARLYRPGPPADGVLVWLHGGGWVVGSLASHDPLCRALAARCGRPVLSVDYRLAPEHTHPAALEDSWAATRWAAESFGRVAVGGDSAGGHLAAVVARRARDAHVSLALQVLVVPVTDYAFETASYAENGTGCGLERATMEWFWRQYVPDAELASDPDVSPLRAADLSGVAPAVVITAGCDPLRDEGDAYARALRSAGVHVEHSCYEGMIHGFFRMPGVLDRSRAAIDQVAAAVRAAL